jgi:23S rRNA pseudouridine2604 synthase
MVTLKLIPPTGPRQTAKTNRSALRGAGSVVKTRPTLAQAQAQREEREARFRRDAEQHHHTPQHPGQRPHQSEREPERTYPPAEPRRSIRDAQHNAHGFEERHRRSEHQQRDPYERRENRPYPGTDHRPYPDQQRAFSPPPRGNHAFDGRAEQRNTPPQNRGHFDGPREHQHQSYEQDSRDHNRYPQPDNRHSSSHQQYSRPDPRQQRQEPPAQPFDPNTFRRDHRRATGHTEQRRGHEQRQPQRHYGHNQNHEHDDAPYHAEQPGSLRLSKRMSQLGMASRREADEWIPKGWVRVDGQVIRELGSRVMPDQHITIDAKARNQQAARVTVLINKPVGYVSGQAEDGYEPALVLVTPQNQWREDRSSVQFLREHLRNLAPAGRLDIDSVGLLVLTQDGRIAKQLVGEDSDVEKEYLVRVHTQTGDPLPDESLALLNHGLELDGQALRSAQVEWVNDDQLRFVLREGRKRQIRRMCEAVGLNVLGLKRVRIGQVMLGHLPPGHWRYLRGDESFLLPPESNPLPETSTPQN